MLRQDWGSISGILSKFAPCNIATGCKTLNISLRTRGLSKQSNPRCWSRKHGAKPWRGRVACLAPRKRKLSRSRFTVSRFTVRTRECSHIGNTADRGPNRKLRLKTAAIAFVAGKGRDRQRPRCHRSVEPASVPNFRRPARFDNRRPEKTRARDLGFGCTPAPVRFAVDSLRERDAAELACPCLCLLMQDIGSPVIFRAKPSATLCLRVPTAT